MRKITPYNPYQENMDSLANASCLISGNCAPVKSKIATQFIDNSFKSQSTMVILDFCYDQYMDHAFHSSPYPLTMFDIDSDTGYDFFYNSGDLHSTINAVALKAQNLGYSHEEIVQIYKYINFFRQLGIPVSDLRNLVSNYYSIDQINAELEKLVRSHTISSSEIPRIMTMLQRSAKGNLLIENILADLDFNLNTNPDTSFSIKQLPQQSLAHLRVNSMYTNMTTALIETLKKDIAEYSEHLNLIVNAGKASVADMLFELVEMVTTHNYNLLFISDDIFSDTTKHDNFRKKFEMNCFGAHEGESSQTLSEIFGTRRIVEEHYSRTTDRRITQNNVIDILLRNNYSEGVAYVPTELPVFRADSISSMDEHEIITMFTKKNNQVKIMRF